MAQFVVKNICVICGEKFSSDESVMVLKKGKLVKYRSPNFVDEFYKGIDNDGIEIKDNEFRVNWINSKKTTQAFHEECINDIILLARMERESKARVEQIVNELRSISKDNNEGAIVIKIG